MTDETPPSTDPSSPRRSSEPVWLALIGLGIALLLFAASALPVLLSGDDGDALDSMAVRPAVTVESSITTTPGSAASTAPSGATATSSTDGAATTTSGAPPATTDPETTEPETTEPETTEPETTDPDTTDPETTTPSPTTTEPLDEVPESRATVLEGKIYLEGAVPDEASRDAIVALASEVLGPDNVVDGYFIDPRASDPNLGQVLVADAVLFETDSAVIAREFLPLLNQGLALLTIRPEARFVIIGHTDSRGDDAYNDYLSEERALSIVRWYAARGIDRSRLTAIGRGEREPIASNDTPAGRQANRRIEVVIENLLSDAG